MHRRCHPDRRTRVALVLALALAAPVAITGSAQAAPSATICAIQGSGAESPMAGLDVTTAGIVTAGDSGDLVYDRVPLAVDVTPVDSPQGARTTVVSNHFKSKFGGTPDNDFFEDCRVGQAQVLRGNVDELPRVALLGDFNAFRDSPTLAALTEGGYANTVDRIPADRRLSYVFQAGRSSSTTSSSPRPDPAGRGGRLQQARHRRPDPPVRGRSRHRTRHQRPRPAGQLPAIAGRPAVRTESMSTRGC
ncbi:MAG: hypothetical protein GEU83_17130 [Pseudonocardiaceae bacterium]|nr:hypothetical protein [Pseudonocardiaceae bacterium]